MEHHHPAEHPNGQEQGPGPEITDPGLTDPSAARFGTSTEAGAAGPEAVERSEWEIDPERSPSRRQSAALGGSPVGRPESAHRDPRSADPLDVDPTRMSPAQQVRHYLHVSFQEADRLGRPIDHDVARAVATLLAATVPPPSALRQYAASGHPDIESIRQECRQLVIRTTISAERLEWAQRLDQYLSTLGAAGIEADAEPAHQERGGHHSARTVADGIAQHGDAFRAFLELSDTDRRSTRLLDDFVAAYVGTFETMDALIEGLTEIRYWQTALDEFADQHGLHGLVSIDRAAITRFATQVWDIVRINGRLYVFNK